jgi:hypothetical protein
MDDAVVKAQKGKNSFGKLRKDLPSISVQLVPRFPHRQSVEALDGRFHGFSRCCMIKCAILSSILIPIRIVRSG